MAQLSDASTLCLLTALEQWRTMTRGPAATRDLVQPFLQILNENGMDVVVTSTARLITSLQSAGWAVTLSAVAVSAPTGTTTTGTP